MNFECYAIIARIILLVILSILGFLLIPKIGWLTKRIGDNWARVLGILLGIVLTGWFVLFQTSILPLNVSIKFHQIYTRNASPDTQDLIEKIREDVSDAYLVLGQFLMGGSSTGKVITSQPQDSVGDAAIIQLEAVPNPKRVYILIHPHNTQYWYVQSPVSFNEDSGYWEGAVYFGRLNGDCGLKFDLIAMASRNSWLEDVFRGRLMKENDQSSYLPMLNRSDVFVVTKECEPAE